MTAHPSRSGAISAELFATFLGQLIADQRAISEPFDIEPRDYVKQCILDAALEVARPRAARKFRWPADFSPALEIDLAGYVHNSSTMQTSTHRGELCGHQRRWLETEVSKISRKALAALEGIQKEAV